MALVLNEEQRILKDAAKNFFVEHSPVEALRTLRDSKDSVGYSNEVWKKMVELGWTAMTIPEAYGGLAFGFQGLGLIFEEAGQTLAASPLFSSLVLGASAIELIANESEKKALLPQVASGDLRLALAFEETQHHAPLNIATLATNNGDDYQLSGDKTFVLDGHIAQTLLVIARSDQSANEDLSLFLVDAQATGVNITRTTMIDSRNAANISFKQVKAKLLGSLGGAKHGLEKTLDRGRAILASEMLGGSLAMFNRTLEYLKEREQFGVKIGSFQALKHRAAIMFIEIELAKSVVLEALTAIDDNSAIDNSTGTSKICSIAKAKLNDVYQLVTNEATQMHGGMGVTDELDVGLFLKRARTSIHALGDSNFHRNRFATLSDY